MSNHYGINKENDEHIIYNERNLHNRFITSRHHRPPLRGILDIIMGSKQEYTVVDPKNKYMTCIDSISYLLNKVNGYSNQLPRTFIFTSSYQQAASLAIAFRVQLGINALSLSENMTEYEVTDAFHQFINKEAPILIFGEKCFKKNVSNVDLLINYDLPPSIAQYQAKLQFIHPKLCVTYISSSADRDFLREIMNAFQTSGLDPPESIKAVLESDSQENHEHLEDDLPSCSESIPSMEQVPENSSPEPMPTTPELITAPEPMPASSESIPPMEQVPENSSESLTTTPELKTAPEPMPASSATIPPMEQVPENSSESLTTTPELKTAPEPMPASSESIPPVEQIFENVSSEPMPTTPEFKTAPEPTSSESIPPVEQIFENSSPEPMPTTPEPTSSESIPPMEQVPENSSPESLTTTPELKTAILASQVFLYMKEKEKCFALIEYLKKLKEQSEYPRLAIFCNGDERCKKLALKIVLQNFRALAIHESALEQFNNGEIDILVISSECQSIYDIDFKKFDILINFDLSPDTETYRHRVEKAREDCKFITYLESANSAALVAFETDLGESFSEVFNYFNAQKTARVVFFEAAEEENDDGVEEEEEEQPSNTSILARQTAGYAANEIAFFLGDMISACFGIVKACVVVAVLYGFVITFNYPFGHPY